MLKTAKDVKDRTKKLKIAFVSIIVITFVFFILYQNIKNNKTLFSGFTLAEAIVVDKVNENNENYYALIQVTENYGGWEKYFLTAKFVQLKSEEYYKLISTGEKYQSLWLGIEISYAEAKNNNLLNTMGGLDVDKVLDNEQYTKKYCTILSMQHS